ncbi:MAG: translocation/assembly module TamB [Aquificaceae bacterium]|nr:translocation/assembly module TamB [Aquificaceae bacterium]
MRVLGYLFLIVLAFYFTFLKPYLFLRNVEWSLEGLRVSFDRGIGFRTFFLHVPSKQTTLHLLFKEAFITPWHIEFGELRFIEVSKAPPAEKPFDYDFTLLTKIASRLSVKVGSFYFSSNYLPMEESLTLLIPEVELRGSSLISKGQTQLYWMSGLDAHRAEILPHQVRLMGDGIFVDKADVKSDMYQMEVKGVWRGKSGSFQAYGRVLPLEGKHFLFNNRTLNLKGVLEYTRIKLSFEGDADLELKDRKAYKNIKLAGDYLWEWRGANQVKLTLWHGPTTFELKYSLKDGGIKGNFSGLLVDRELVGVERDVLASVSGELEVDLGKKTLKLSANAPSLKIDQNILETVSLKLTADYSKEFSGSLEFSSLKPFSLNYRGDFSGSNISGRATVSNYAIKDQKLSATLSYEGELSYQKGSLYAQGGGKVLNINYEDLSLGSADYKLNLSGDEYKLRMAGEGFSLSGNGSVKSKSFLGKLSLEGKGLSYKGVETKNLLGYVNLKVEGSKVNASGNLSGVVSRQKDSLNAVVSFDVFKGDKGWFGSFNCRLKDVKTAMLSYAEGEIKGKLEGEKVYLTYGLGKETRGEGYYNFSQDSYQFKGYFSENLRGIRLASQYSLRGVKEDLELLLSGKVLHDQTQVPIQAKFSARGDRLEGSLDGFNIKHGLFTVKVGGIKLYGSRKSGNVEVAPSYVMLGREVIGRLDFEKGSYSDMSFSINGRVSGLAEGGIKVGYQKELKVFSEGSLDVEKFLNLTKSRLMTEGEGKAQYYLSYDEKGTLLSIKSSRISLRSRYIATPLWGNFELNMKDEDLWGSLRLFGEYKSLILADISGKRKDLKLNYEVRQVPIFYRGDNAKASLTLFGKGVLSHNSERTKIEGNFITSGFVNIVKGPKERKPPSEEYKRLHLNITVKTSEPLKINLPEGFVYTELSANIGGSLYEPIYDLRAHLTGGNLKYFDKNFFVRKGHITFTDVKNNIELTLVSHTPDYNILIDLKGDPKYPKVLVNSEPPRDTKEVLTRLVLGGGGTEGLIPVTKTILTQLPQLSDVAREVKGMTGVDFELRVYPSASPTGEAGVNAVISKDLTDRISVEHKQSTFRNPKENYTGGEIKLTPDASMVGRLYSNQTREVRIRLRRKFDF